MQNKFRFVETGNAIVWDVPSQNNFRASKVDELIIQSTEIVRSGEGASGAFQLDTFVIPLNLSNFVSGAQTVFSVSSVLERQDAKRTSMKRLPQAVIGCGLVIFSQNDSYEQYFVNSFKMVSRGGVLRWGICNFTATEANNPLTEEAIPTKQFHFSFFDLNS